MPTILHWRGCRFFFSSLDVGEPPHIHVESERGHAKFWLQPVLLAKSRGLRVHELSRIRHIVEINASRLLERWHEHFRR